MTNELEPKNNLPAKATMAHMPDFQPPEQQENMRMARLLLMQDLSPRVKDRTFMAGEMINSLSKESYGTSVEVIPLFQGISSRIRWKTRSNGGGIACIARDGKVGEGDPGGTCDTCPFHGILKGKDKEDDQWCSMNYRIIALIRETGEPIMLTADSIKSSDAGVRDMLAMARMAAAKGVRLFGKAYKLSSAPKKNAQGDFHVLTCVPAAALPIEEVEAMAQKMQFFSGTKLEDGEEAPF